MVKLKIVYTNHGQYKVTLNQTETSFFEFTITVIMEYKLNTFRNGWRQFLNVIIICKFVTKLQ